MYDPNLICIIESWLDSNILDSEIAILGYQLHCLDWNRHGGGVLLYIKDVFHFTLLSTPNNNIELLSAVVQHNSIPIRVCLSLFYRPPSSAPEILDHLCEHLDYLNIAPYTNFIILGDFNLDVSNCFSSFVSKTQLHHVYIWIVSSCR